MFSNLLEPVESVKRTLNVRISLDYYRILSVPVKATPEQLEQAYEDRSQQQPRREYGERSILARQKLLQQAYEVLSDSQQRAEYDSRFLGTNPPLEIPEPVENEGEAIPPAAVNPTIEIAKEHIVGALLILQELGEYELVIKLATIYLNAPQYLDRATAPDETVRPNVDPDAILSLALAYMELSREQWHRREYEAAAMSGQMGVDLLSVENLFPSVREELQTDLCKLRPYRILELTARYPSDSAERTRALKLLKEMLDRRKGIEGEGKDFSGLDFDRFLCFIQQLRNYLTSQEQEKLFDTEAKRPSPIASYLAAYAAIALGFVFKQPQLIFKAQQMLQDLSQRQNVYWERAICALLLGKTDLALENLHKSPDRANIELIEQYSQGQPDWLPGLCLYGEKWLKEEVLTQFCDLTGNAATLKQYFADREVQDYLEGLVVPVQTATPQPLSPSLETTKATPAPQKRQGFFGLGKKANSRVVAKSTAVNVERSAVKSIPSRELVNSGVAQARTSTVDSNNGSTRTNSPPGKTAERNFPEKAAPVAMRVKPKPLKRQPLPRHLKKQNKVAIWSARILFLLGLILGLSSLGFVLTKLLLDRSNTPVASEPTKEAELAIGLKKAPVTLPQPKPQAAKPKPQVTFDDTAKQTVQQWLDSKSAAFGKGHQIDSLNNILTGSLLKQWHDRALDYQKSQMYREYKHEVNIRSAEIDKQNSNRATVEAQVKETATHYQGGKVITDRSYNDNLVVRYQLIRQGDKWSIEQAQVLQTLPSQ
jgi:curved DNA-binding protein CbpA